MLDVCPGINTLFLYQANARAEAFSASFSGSANVPGLQVRFWVETVAIAGDMEGAESAGALSG